MSEPIEVDILIIGGGLIGASLMLALRNLGYHTRLVEATSFSSTVDAPVDRRTLALSPASIRLLNMLHLWPRLEEDATPIDGIHVSEQGCFGHTRFYRDKEEPLGFVVEMQAIHQVLYQVLDKKNIIAPAVVEQLDPMTGFAMVKQEDGSTIPFKARLIVAADGTGSLSRQQCGLSATVTSYEQQAFIATIDLARTHRNQAYERFTSSGPLALLPMKGQRSSLIWGLSPAEASTLQARSTLEIRRVVQQAFGYRLGRFLNVGPSVLYPLKQVVVSAQVCGVVVFVGNAAHTLHPVAGQGFNLGLRDVAMLAQCIATQGLEKAMLDSYQRARAYDQTAIRYFTEGLIRVFGPRYRGVGACRGIGLAILDNLPWLKKELARYTRGFAGVTPDLVCGIPLSKGATRDDI